MKYMVYSVRSLSQRKLRSWLTLVGVIIGVATIIGLLSVSQGMQNAIEDILLSFGANNIRVVPENTNGPPVGGSGLTNDDVKVVERTNGVEYAAGIIIQIGEVKFGREVDYLLVGGADSGLAERLFEGLNLEFAEGRSLKQGETKVAVIGHGLAYNVFDKDIRLKNKIAINGHDFKVVGIFKETGSSQTDNYIYIPLDVARDIFEKSETVNAILAHVSDDYNVNEVGLEIEENLADYRKNENFEVLTPEQLIRRIQGVLGLIGIVLAGIAVISIIVGGIGITNSMFTNVLERTRDIGVMKALGASNKSIMLIFLGESLLFGATGGIAGTAAGYGLSYAIAFIAKSAGFGLIAIRPTIGLISLGVFFSSLIGMIAGFIPAYLASKIPPIESLRYE